MSVLFPEQETKRDIGKGRNFWREEPGDMLAFSPTADLRMNYEDNTILLQQSLATELHLRETVRFLRGICALSRCNSKRFR